MDAKKRFDRSRSLLVIFSAFLLITACSPTPPPTPFIAPRAATPTLIPVPGDTPVLPTATSQPRPTSSPTATPPCTNGMAFVEDVTVPDGTIVAPGASIDKQWLVENDGTCNWDARYRLKFTGGSNLGAATEQALFPARAGSQATIRMSFTAPSEPGDYSTAWQAIDPDGEPFGDAVFMQITVQPEAVLTLEIIDGTPQ